MADNEKNPFEEVSEYDFNNLIEHLEGGDQGAILHDLLALETPSGRNGWYEIREARNEIDGYLANIGRAWRLSIAAYTSSSKVERDSAVGHQCRYALIMASISSMTGNIPVELLVSLVDKGILDPDTGLIYAQRLADPFQQARAVVGLAPHLDMMLLREAHSIARQYWSAFAKVMTFVGLAPYFPLSEREALLDEARAATKSIDIQEDQIKALSDIAHQFAKQGFPTKALDAVHAIPKLEASKRAMAELAPLLAELGFHQEALDAAKMSVSGECRAEALAAIAPFLPASYFDQALALADQIVTGSSRSLLARFVDTSEGWSYIRALSGLLPYLPPKDFRHCLEVVSQVSSVGYKRKGEGLLSAKPHVEALSRLAPHLPELLIELLVWFAPFLSTPSVVWKLLEKAASGMKSLLGGYQRNRFWREVISKARSAKEGWQLVKVLEENRLRLIELGLLNGYLDLALSIDDQKKRADALAAIAPHISPTSIGTVLKAIRAIDDEDSRVKLLVAFSPCLSKEHVAEAFEMAQALVSEEQRAQALAAISPFLSPELLHTAFLRTRFIGDAATVEKVAKVLSSRCGVLRVTPPGKNLSSATAALDKLRPQGELMLASQVSSQAKHPSHEEQFSAAFQLAQAIKDDYNRADEVARLFQSLPISVRDKVLREALDNALSIQDEEPMSYALAGLARCLPEPLLREALKRTKELYAVNTDPAMRGLFAQTMAELLPRLAELGFHEEALDEADKLPETGWQYSPRNEAFRQLALILAKIGIPKASLKAVEQINDEQYRWIDNERMVAPGLLDLIGNLVNSGYPDLALQVAKSIKFERRRTLELAKLASRLCEKLLLDQALQAILAIESIPVRTEALAQLVPYFLELPPHRVHAFWLIALPVLARERQGLLLSLEALEPVIIYLGGKRAVSQTIKAIRDVSRWWL